MLVLQLLGGLHVRFEGKPLPARAGQRKRGALLVLLAAAPERVVTRERLIGMLWPEHDTTRARHQLAAAAHDLRSAIGSLLSVEGDALALSRDGVVCDLWDFTRALETRNASEALRLYRGPLIDGFHLPALAEFERWVTAERDRLEREYSKVLEEAAAAASASGAVQEAVEWWSARAARDPYDSRVAVHLMRALAAAGNRAGALRHARLHTSLVRSELEVEPDPVVTRFAAELQAGQHIGLPATESPPDPADASADHDVPSALATPAVVVEPQSTTRPARRRPALFLSALGLALALSVAALWLRSERAAAVGIALSTRSRADRTGSLTAHALYLRGRSHWSFRSRMGLDSAVIEFRRATEEDPLYAAAYSGLAEAYAMLGYFGYSPGDAAFPKAKVAAYRALELEPRDGDAYAALGQALAWEHRWVEAESVYRRGTSLAPENATLHQWYGLLEAYLGRSHLATTETAIAARLDPLSVQINNMYATMRFEDGDTVGALRHFERTVDAEPDSLWVQKNPWVLDNYASVLGAVGRHAQALHLLSLALRVVPTHPRPLLTLAQEYVRVGDTARAVAAFARADHTHPHYGVYRGLFAAALGRTDEAFAWLEGVGEWSLPALVALNNGPKGKALRADPRYARLRARLGMPRQ